LIDEAMRLLRQDLGSGLITTSKRISPLVQDLDNGHALEGTLLHDTARAPLILPQDVIPRKNG
jgi:hypothetical protein